jgi:hypothetical protein
MTEFLKLKNKNFSSNQEDFYKSSEVKNLDPRDPDPRKPVIPEQKKPKQEPTKRKKKSNPIDPSRKNPDPTDYPDTTNPGQKRKST